MTHIRIVVTVLGLLAFTATVPSLKAQEIGGGAIVKAKTTVPVYRAPPEGAFYNKGAVVDSARTGDSLRVVETREVATLSARYLWLKVLPLGARARRGDPDRRVAGWVFAGPVGGASNFQLTVAKPSRSH